MSFGTPLSPKRQASFSGSSKDHSNSAPALPVAKETVYFDAAAQQEMVISPSGRARPRNAVHSSPAYKRPVASPGVLASPANASVAVLKKPSVAQGSSVGRASPMAEKACEGEGKKTPLAKAPASLKDTQVPCAQPQEAKPDMSYFKDAVTKCTMVTTSI